MDDIGYTWDNGGWYIVLPQGRIGPFIGGDKAEGMTRLVQQCLDDAYEHAATEIEACNTVGHAARSILAARVRALRGDV